MLHTVTMSGGLSLWIKQRHSLSDNLIMTFSRKQWHSALQTLHSLYLYLHTSYHLLQAAHKHGVCGPACVWSCVCVCVGVERKQLANVLRNANWKGREQCHPDRNKFNHDELNVSQDQRKRSPCDS